MNSRDAAEFWRNVDVTDDMRDCWKWKGGLTAHGYGHLRRDGKLVMAHRVAWQFAYERCPPADRIVLHACDVAACVNPRHLRLGTHADNTLDRTLLSRVRKVLSEDAKASAREAEQDRIREQSRELERLDRLVPGGPDNLKYARASNWLYPTTAMVRAKQRRLGVTDADILDIRARYANGTGYRVIAAELGLPELRVKGIIERRTWRHLP